MEKFFENYSSYKKKSVLVKIISEFCTKIKELRDTTMINEIAIITELSTM